MTRKVLITGSSGIIGSELFDSLQKSKVDVTALPYRFDQGSEIREFFRTEKWTDLIHLGGISSVPECEKNPYSAMAVNVGATAFLCDLITRYNPSCRLIFSSTSHVYAPPTSKDEVLRETADIQPRSVYAQSKYSAESVIREFSEISGLRCVILRLFNHASRAQSADFFLSKILSSIQASTSEVVKIRIGNLDVYRDIGLVVDASAAIASLIQSQIPIASDLETLNVSSGSSRNLRILALEMGKQLGKKLVFEIDDRLIRPNEPIRIQGSNLKLQNLTHWAPRILTDEQFISRFLNE